LKNKKYNLSKSSLVHGSSLRTEVKTNRLKFLHRWLLLLALASILTSCLPLQVDLGATPSPQKSLTPVFTSTSTSEPTLIPSGTPTATLALTALPLATPTLAPTPPPYLGLVPQDARLRISKGGIQFMALSPDGKNVVIATSIILCSYRVLDAVENWCKTIGEAPGTSIQSLAFDPSGKTIVTGLKVGLVNGEIILWDVSKGVQNLVIQTDLNLMSNPTWSPDGQKLAYTGSDRAGNGTIQIWNSRDGSILQHIWAVPYLPDILSWSPDGSTIAGSDFSGLITLWDARSGDELSFHRIFPQQHAVSSLAWSPDSTELLAGSRYISCAENCSPTFDGKIVLIDAQSGAQRWQIDVGQVINSLAISPDGTLLLAGIGQYRSEVSQYHHEVRLYRMSDGSLVRTVTLASTSPIAASKYAFWFPDSQRLLTLDGEGNLAVWDTSGAKRSEVHLDEYIQLTGIAWSPDGTQLATNAYQGIFVWDALSGRLIRSFGAEEQYEKIAWSPDGKTLASAKGRQVFQWDAQTGNQIRSLTASGDYPRDLDWSKDGNLFASLSLSGLPIRYAFIDIWNTSDWSHSQVIKIDYFEENYPEYFAWSPDGKTLATIGRGINLWDVSSGKLAKTFARDMGLFSSIAWSPDGQNLLTVMDQAQAMIVDAGSGAIRVQIKGDENDPITSAALSPDGKIIATGGNDINLYNAQDGKLLTTLSGNADYADRLAFSPDGKTLASGSADGTVILWKNPLAGTNPKNGESNGPSLSTDGRFIVFTSQSKDLVNETLPICPTPDGQGIPCPQVYLFDRQTGSMELISRGEEGKPANGPTSGMISRDGQKVLLVSQANNLSSQGQSGLYLLDRATRAIKFVGAGGHPALSGEGRLVVFEKTNQKMSFDEIYLYDDQAGTTQNLSNGSSGENADGESMLPAISADDQWVAFWSWSSQIVTKIPGKCTIKGPNASCGDVYLKNLRTGKTDRIAVDEPYGEGMISYPISLSNDARWVAFKGAIYDHQTGEPILQYCLPEINCAGGTLSRDGQWIVYAKAGDIFIQNRSGGSPEQVSVSSEGTPGNGSSIDSIACKSAPGCTSYPKFDLSADGRLVVFDSTASNLVPGDNRMCDDKVSILHNCQDIFLRDRQTGKTEWISKP